MSDQSPHCVPIQEAIAAMTEADRQEVLRDLFAALRAHFNPKASIKSPQTPLDTRHALWVAFRHAEEAGVLNVVEK